MKPYRETFNDGFLQYGHKQTQRSATGKRIGEAVFKPDGKLAYKEMSCRDSDYQMAEIMGASLDLKVKTLCPPSLKKMNKNKFDVVIDSIEYDVIKVDSDSSRLYLFFYLQKVGVISE